MPDEPTIPTSPAPDPAPNAGTGLAPNVAAGICCIFPLVGSIIFLLIEKKDEFVRFWAAQMLILCIVAVALSIAMGILFVIFGAIHLVFLVRILSPLYSLAMFVIWLVCIVKAFTGKKWEIPVISNYIPMVLGWFKTV
jgi:uncharacterized membrane protein